jgi:hypothetical protein
MRDKQADADHQGLLKCPAYKSFQQRTQHAKHLGKLNTRRNGAIASVLDDARRQSRYGAQQTNPIRLAKRVAAVGFGGDVCAFFNSNGLK